MEFIGGENLPPEMREALERAMQAHDRQHMEAESNAASMRRLVVEELSPDHLLLLSTAIGHIAQSDNPVRSAAYLEGFMDGALSTRDLRLGEAPAQARPEALGHEFEDNVDDLDDPYCARPGCGLPPSNEVHRGGKQ